MIRFELVQGPIAPPQNEHGQAGGFVTFEGKVRDHNEGQVVERLEYEAYSELACHEGEAICREAAALFGLHSVYLAHRIGVLEIGETALYVSVGAAHREPVFLACSWIVDEVKRRLPVWKKEHYATGASDWLNCSLPSDLGLAYSRQTSVSEIGPEGQAKILAAKVLVVGAGGLGCAALPYLAGAGVGTIGIAESDFVDLSNLQRQTLFARGQIGLPKAGLAAHFARRINPDIDVLTHPHLVPSNATDIIRQYDLVVDGSDNFATKFMLNDFCLDAGIPLVTASIHRLEGQILVVRPGSQAGCLRCLWPEAPYDGCVETCSDSGVLGPLAGVFGSLQASEALKLIAGFGEPLDGCLVLLDLRDLNVTRITRFRNAACSSCGSGVAPRKLVAEISDLPAGTTVIDLSPSRSGPVGAVHCPWSGCMDAIRQVARDHQPVALYCETGTRSSALAHSLRESGIDAVSVTGGKRALGT